MKTKSLTDVIIRQIKPTNKMRKITDGAGLYLEVAPTGGKLWRYAYRFNGKQKLLALGKYPDVSLQEARKRHIAARERLAQGIDPSVARKVEKQVGAQRAANTFEVVSREWLEVWKNGKAKTTVEHMQSRLRNDILPWLGDRPVASITTPEILATGRNPTLDTGYR
jgi:hypothetical protein